MIRSVILSVAALSGLSSPLSSDAVRAPKGTLAERLTGPDISAYDPEKSARADVSAAVARARQDSKNVVIVMGANWCHDSTRLAGWMTTPRFTAMLKPKYEVVFVDVGTPQSGDGRNLDIARQYGINRVKNTPLLMIVDTNGKLLNSKKDAAGWRNAASRSQDAIYRYFAEFTGA